MEIYSLSKILRINFCNLGNFYDIWGFFSLKKIKIIKFHYLLSLNIGTHGRGVTHWGPEISHCHHWHHVPPIYVLFGKVHLKIISWEAWRNLSPLRFNSVSFRLSSYLLLVLLDRYGNSRNLDSLRPTRMDIFFISMDKYFASSFRIFNEYNYLYQRLEWFAFQWIWSGN